MKGILLLAALLCFSWSINAQIKKGTLIIVGQASYYQVDYSPNTDYAKSSKNPSLVISVGKAYKDNNVWGISAGYLANTFSNTIYIGGYEQSGDMNTYSASVFNRKYEKIITALYTFSDIGAGGSFSNYQSSKTFSAFLYGTPGIAYRVRKKIFVELLLPNLVRLSYYNRKRNYPANYEVDNSEITYAELTSNLNLASFATGIRINL